MPSFWENLRFAGERELDDLHGQEGGDMVCYVSHPLPSAGTSFPTVIVIQEAFGVTRHIEKVCDREGYGDRLRERLPQRMVGHQIGVEVHEDPWLRPDQKQELVDGMVFCIEPKLWHRGEYYLRVEDMVLIKNGKAESLTTYDRELFKL